MKFHHEHGIFRLSMCFWASIPFNISNFKTFISALYQRVFFAVSLVGYLARLCWIERWIKALTMGLHCKESRWSDISSMSWFRKASSMFYFPLNPLHNYNIPIRIWTGENTLEEGSLVFGRRHFVFYSFKVSEPWHSWYLGSGSTLVESYHVYPKVFQQHLLLLFIRCMWESLNYENQKMFCRISGVKNSKLLSSSM